MVSRKGREGTKEWEEHVHVRSHKEVALRAGMDWELGEHTSDCAPYIPTVKDNIFILVPATISRTPGRRYGASRYLFSPLERTTSVNQHFQSRTQILFEKIMWWKY